MRKLFTIAFLLVLSHFLFSQQTFVKRFNRGIQANFDSNYLDFVDIFNNGSSIFIAGHPTSNTVTPVSPIDLYKIDKNGTPVWVKHYSIENAYTYSQGKTVLSKGAIYSSIPIYTGINYGINLTKYDTISGNVIYSKNIELPQAGPSGTIFMLELDSLHMLINFNYILLKVATQSGSVVCAYTFDSGIDYLSFQVGLKNSDYSIILAGYLSQPSFPYTGEFTIRIKNDNSFSFLGGIDFGRFNYLFKKSDDKLMGFARPIIFNNTPPAAVELDTTFNIIKYLSPNQLFNYGNTRFFKRNNRIFIHNYSNDMVIDTAFNYTHCRVEYVPADFQWWPGYVMTGVSTFMGNGIYSIKCNTVGVNYDKSIFVRSDTNFVDPCNSGVTATLFTPTTAPIVNSFSCNVTPVTPTVVNANYTITLLNVIDSTYCTTTTDVKSVFSDFDYKLRYNDRIVSISSEKVIRYACLFDIFGRKIVKFEGIQNLEIPYDSQPPGIYFIEIIFTDNTMSRVKILLH
jgi:hypothetical protein